MEIRQIQLNGSETAVHDISGFFACITNTGTSTLYVSTAPNIEYNNVDSLAIPQGASFTLAMPYNSKTLYLLGNGTVSIEGKDHSTYDNNNATMYYVDTSLQRMKNHIIANTANENLLINSDFGINQRKSTLYNTDGYTVDRWRLWKYSATTYGTVKPADNGLLLTSSGEGGSIMLSQLPEMHADLVGKTVTISLNAEDVTGEWFIQQHGSTNILRFNTSGTHQFTFVWANETSIMGLNFGLISTSTGDASCKLKWIKLELGENATAYFPPDPTTELTRCQRYYQVRSTGDVDPLDLRPSMRSIPTITATDNGYAYDAEIR